MKKVLILVALLVLAVGVQAKMHAESTSVIQRTLSTQPTRSIPPSSLSQTSPSARPVEINSKSIFVPYWGVDTEITAQKYDSYIYFGISANENGIDTEETGYKNLPAFVSAVKTSKKHLALRLLDTDSNLKILENASVQKEIIAQTLALANKYGFDGIVIDLELSVLPIVDYSPKLNAFYGRVYKEAKKEQLQVGTAMYGDVFYRARPFDIAYIADNTDEILIMAYDFSKTYGEPGPNFPLAGKTKYGYDLQLMIADFSQKVAPEKLTVIFGLYGYDWTLGKQGQPLKKASAVTLNQANAKFMQTCKLHNCQLKRDTESAELTITYEDADGYKHVVWLPDEETTAAKIAFLGSKGIARISYWAYGYN